MIRTRFAPSPTGYLHIGGARTALFNFLFAKHHGGKFILRIEDTDKARSTQASTDAIVDGMKWLQLDWDEGPFFQSQRTALYQEKAKQLLANNLAYYCDCSPEMLEQKRAHAMQTGQKPMYDGTCRQRQLTAGVDRVVRFKAPTSGSTVVHDLIKGDVTFNNAELDDMVLLRADGSPTYNFVVVVDDIDMRLTHIIRGDDHLNNTPKQILLYQALGATLPAFAHLPLILGSDKSRLSKRHGATALHHYQEAGYLPAAMLNFLARLGWSHGDEEIFSMTQLIEKFTLENVGKSAGVFNAEKLLWLNHHYLRQLTPVDLTEQLKPFIIKAYGAAAAAQLQQSEWQMLQNELSERCKTLEEYIAPSAFYFQQQIPLDPALLQQHVQADTLAATQSLIAAIEKSTRYDAAQLEVIFKTVLEQHQLKMKALAQVVRLALTGTLVSPGIYNLLMIVGKARSLARLKQLCQQGQLTAKGTT